MTQYAVKNEGPNILTVPGHTSIHPGEVEVLPDQHKDRIVENFGDEVKVEEYTPAEDEEGEDSDEGGVLDQSISDLENTLATGEYDDQLDALFDNEKEGQDRKGAKEAINDRIDELSEGE